MPSLSICIPTYNRSRLLAELLDSIILQNEPDVEVVVSDDASPDDTADVVAAYTARLPNLKFIRQEKNVGVDRNFRAVVAAASGEYVWLMGDDDRLEPGGVKNVLTALDRWPGVAGMTVGAIDYAPDFSAATGIRTMPPTQMLSGIEQVFGELIDLLGFISALVIRRELWDVVCREDRVSDFENFYVQVYIIGRALRRVPDWGVLNTPCVGYRTSNDQFLGKFGWLKRLQIDVTGYDQLGRGIFEDNEAARNAMRRRIFRAHILARVRNAKTSPGRTPDLIAASKLLLQVYGDLPEFWRSAVPILLMPKSIVVIARRLYQRYSANSGAYRARQLAARNT